MRGLIAAVMLLTLAASAWGTPAGSGGGTSSASEETNLEGWFAIGAAALVAGLLVWDIISDSRSETPAGPPEPLPLLQDTGIDWEGLRDGPVNQPVIGVSVFPSENGWALAQYFQQLLLPLEENGCLFGGDPVDLGRMSPAEQAAMAGDFLQLSWFIAAEGRSLLLFTGGETPAWSSTVASWDSASVRSAALDLLVSAPSLR